MTTDTELSSRTDLHLPARFARSGAHPEGVGPATAEVPGWLEQYRRDGHCAVRRIPFSALEGWSSDPATDNLVHRSGRFFTVEGLDVLSDCRPIGRWQQPIIVQPEIGILGILAREFGGVLHFLMQAKMEPGNPNLVQLSPTVQATRSNYTRVHSGGDVPYLEYFTEPVRGRVISDVLQSEHGAWFFRKRNRNMIVELDTDVPVRPGFQWLTLGQIGELLRHDLVVNMDARSILATAPAPYREHGARLSDVELWSRIAAERSRRELWVSRIPLNRVARWKRGDDAVEHELGRYFRVVAVAVQGGEREVARWTQPLIEPLGEGVLAFVVRRFGGVPHLLVSARVEAGFLNTLEIGPTVQCIPDSYAHLRGADRPAFLDTVLRSAPDAIRYDVRHSEEGGRFLNAVSRHLIVEAGPREAPSDPPPGYLWVTPGQLSTLALHTHTVNVQARTFLAALNTGAVSLS